MVQKATDEFRGKAPYFRVRYLQCFLIFTGIAIAFAVRVNFSMAIVAMTDKKSTGQDFEEYSWSEKTKSLLLSSFFWGYVMTQILGGYLARRFGGKYSILISCGAASTLALLTPLAAKLGGWQLLCGVRMLQGMSQGVLFPTTHTILAKWAPPQERGVLGTCCYSGVQLGTVAMLLASGFIAASRWGWPAIFYISGGLGVLWCFAWHHWGASAPSECRKICSAEREFIEASLASNKATSNNNNNASRNSAAKVPWLKFLGSPAFLAIMVAHCAYNWGFWTILTEIPSYMKNIMGFNIKSNALLTSLPYLTMMILNFVFIAMAAYIERRKWLTLTQTRKLFNTISAWIPAAALAGLGFVDASRPKLAVALLMVAVGFSAAMHLGFQINHIDLAPNFAGIMLGITNTASNTMSLLAPLTVGYVVTEEKNILQWRLVFLIAAGYIFVGNLLFIIFGSGKVQDWNETEFGTAQELKPMKSDSKASKVEV